MLSKWCLLAGGVFNALFFAFHGWLAVEFQRSKEMSPNVKALLQTFNFTGMLFIGFFAFVSLVYPTEMLCTRVGRAVMVLVILVYVGRVVEEYLLFPRPEWWIAVTCLVVAAVYIIPLFNPGLLRSAG